MCEAVQRIVPGCQLYFATQSPADARPTRNRWPPTSTRWCADGCRVILDDAFFSNENPFQDSGPVAQAVIAARTRGVMYFSCSANYGNEDSVTSSCWEGDFAGTDMLQE